MQKIHASIVVLTYNQADKTTKPCVASLLANTDLQANELILVDNASSDDTADFLRATEKQHDNIHIHLNTTNKGYAGGNNDGMRLARGQYIVLLNNDTLVGAGWLPKLLRLLEKNPRIGMVGPVTNSAGNEQRIAIKGLNEKNFDEASSRYTTQQEGAWFTADKLGFFCVAMRRNLLDKIGFLDEKFGIGMFEDDDYCLRIRNIAKQQLAIVEDCFVFHKGSISFSKLDADEYRSIFEKNRDYFFEKHHIRWAFSDLALSYWSKFDRDLKAYAQAHPDELDPAIERLLVRFENFKHLLIQVHSAETKHPPLSGKTISDAGNMGRWAVRWDVCKREFLRGSLQQKRNYLSAIVGALGGQAAQPTAPAPESVAAPPPPPVDFAPLVAATTQMRHSAHFKKVIFIPATIDFHYMKQRPQHLAEAFAEAGFLVLYGTLNHRIDTTQVVEKINERLYLIEDKYFPYLHHAFTPEESIYYCLWPNNAKYLGHLKFSYLIYDIMDDIGLLELPIEEMLPLHNQLIEQANLITVSARRLLDSIAEKYQQKTLLVNNGVAHQFIELVEQAQPSALFDEIGANRPIIGYTGAIAEWFDFALIAYLAKENPHLVFVFVGPVLNVESDVGLLQSMHDNVFFYPPVKHEEIPSILQAFTVSIIPFIKNDITDAVSPVKLFEYMGTGRPIVTTDIAECHLYAEVMTANNPVVFHQKLTAALAKSDDPGFTSAMKQAAKRHLWGARIQPIVEKIPA